MDQRWIDPSIYRTAMKRVEQYDASKLETDLHNVTRGKRNTLLHLAAAAGNLDFIKHLLLHPKLEDKFLLATNVNGDTALHEAAGRGHQQVVEDLLFRHRDLLRVHNNLGQTPFFKACESGHLGTVKTLVEADSSALSSKSSDGRTCLHVAVNRLDPELLQYLLEKVGKKDNLIQEQDNKGNTVLHLAVQRNCAYTVRLLLRYQPDLCYSLNGNEETPLCMAVKLGFLEVVRALVNSRPDSLEMLDRNGKSVLHLAVEQRHVSVVKFLIEETDLSQLINQPDGSFDDKKKVEQSRAQVPDEGKDPSTKVEEEQAKYLESGGNTPLHIAASIKNFDIVELLVGAPGVNKAAVNNEGLTPLDIARDNTDYHESYKIIEMLTSYPPECRPFLYNAPTVSKTKHKKSMEILEKTYSDRRNTELVVAVLLATMAFSAVFQIPGGFRTEDEKVDRSSAVSPSPAPAPPPSGQERLGSPVLIKYDSFKLFLIFDCVAFFLSLFVVLMWTVSTPLSTGDQMLFMCITVVVTCVAFAFVTYGFMCAVYTMLWYKHETLAWVVLGSSMLICLVGNVACFHSITKFAVRRARFHRLCGVPRLLDRAVEHIWIKAERIGILDILRCINDKSYRALISGQRSHQTTAEDKGKSGAGSSSSAPPPEVGQERV